MRPDADLSLTGHARLLAGFIEGLDLHDVVLVQNDIAIAQVLAGERYECIGRLVLVSCEAFDNYPPGLPGRLAALAGMLPGGVNALGRRLGRLGNRRGRGFGRRAAGCVFVDLLGLGDRTDGIH